MSKFKLSQIGVISLSAALLLSACGDMTDDNDTEIDTNEPGVEAPANGTTEDPAETEMTSETEGQSDQGVQDREFEMSLDDAVQLFNDTFPDAEGIDQVQFDVDDGRFEYEMDGFSGTESYELTIDAETGDIQEQETDDDDDTETAIDFDRIISPQEAMNTALDEVGSGYVKEWDLETDDGRTLYEIDIEGQDGGDDDDVYVDAESGEFFFDD